MNYFCNIRVAQGLLKELTSNAQNLISGDFSARVNDQSDNMLCVEQKTYPSIPYDLLGFAIIHINGRFNAVSERGKRRKGGFSVGEILSEVRSRQWDGLFPMSQDSSSNIFKSCQPQNWEHHVSHFRQHNQQGANILPIHYSRHRILTGEGCCASIHGCLISVTCPSPDPSNASIRTTITQ